MIIYTFGSGLQMENNAPDYLRRFREDVEYAHSRGIEVGGYSLLASRTVSPEADVINPETGKTGGAIFGNSPCLAAGVQACYRGPRLFDSENTCEMVRVAIPARDFTWLSIENPPAQ